MTGVVWSKFFWSDWLSEPSLRVCSYAARGLWMDMLCIAAGHDPIGYVAVAGRGLDETSIARMTGGLESEVSALLGELERNGVFSRDRHGRIFSRRMVADARRSANARKNGKSGGNPKLCNNKRNSASDKAQDKAALKPHKPEAKSQEPVRETRAPPGADDLIRQNREVAEAAGDALADMAVCPGIANLSALRALLVGEPPCDWTLDVLPAVGAAAAWHRGKTGPGSMRSWTTAARIAIENRDKRLAGAPSAKVVTLGTDAWDEDTWRVALRNWRADPSRWSPSMGPKPGEPGCRAPAHLLIGERAA